MRSAILLLLTLLAVLATPPSAAETAPSGEARWPLSPRPAVVEGFDAPADPWGAGHRGADLAGSLGQPVRSALPGRVSFAGRIAGRGVVVVSHGETRTTYEPVGAVVRLGQEVAAGQVIGTLEAVGSHCFPAACLHWGLLRGETYLDPLTLVGGGPVRLLPLAGGAAAIPTGPTTVGEAWLRGGGALLARAR
ncbi:hypothetical protein GCM10027425_21140 [Alteromonas gracilis]